MIMTDNPTSKTIGSAEWIKDNSQYFGKIYSDIDYNKPEICLWESVSDMIQVDKGNWVIMQFEEYKKTSKFDVNSCMSELYNWEFLEDFIIVKSYWSAFSVAKVSFSDLVKIMKLQVDVIFDKIQPHGIEIKFFNFHYTERSDLIYFNIDDGSRIE